MKPLISIIVPVYNVEQYLRKCLDSCVNQTLKEIEIIVVNDCSPDNSDIIMREYEEKYPDIVKCIYLKENIKQGGARNRGLEIAQGDYILFVDSDDYIAENMCEEMYKSAKSNEAEIVICNYYRVSNSNKNIRTQIDIKIEDVEDISKKFLLQHRINQGILCKLYKKELFCSNYFPENVVHEDLAVTLVWILKASKINYLSIPLYYYCYREDSVMCKTDYFTKLEYSNAIVSLIENLRKSNLFQQYYEDLAGHILKEVIDFICIYILQFLEYGLEDLKFFIDTINRYMPDWETIIDSKESFTQYERNIIYNFLLNPNYIKELQQKNETYFLSTFKGKKVAIWGAGLYGNNVLSYVQKYKLKPEYIIDNNENLHATYIDNILVSSFYNISNKCDVIIIAIKDNGIYNELKEEIKNKNDIIKVIHYTEFLMIK